MVTAKIDKKGRIIIPKKMRKKLSLKDYVTIKSEEKCIIIEPAEPVADKFFGTIKVDHWPEDLDEFSSEAIKRWWTKST